MAFRGDTRAAAACWLVAGIAYTGLEAIAAAAVPGYRYGEDFISDLGRPDSPLSCAMLAIASTTPVAPAAVWERLSVYTIIAWQLLSAGVLLGRRP